MKTGEKIVFLSLGDGISKALYFVSFVYLARVLGAEAYGVLEFTVSVVTYFLLLADSGMEIWGIRAIAQGESLGPLFGRVFPLKILLATLSFGMLLAVLPLFPDYQDVQRLLLLFGISLFTQAFSVKWVLMGQERFFHVGCGLVLSHLIFASVVIGAVQEVSDLVWVPISKILGDVVMAGYFGGLVFRTSEIGAWTFSLVDATKILRPSIMMGATQTLGILNYNFDTIFLGFLMGSVAVGLYGAAYKPVTAILAIPLMIFLGLFPILSRAFMENREWFAALVFRLQHLVIILVLPLGVAATFSADWVIGFLYGEGFTQSVLALKVLVWSMVLVILRGIYRQALNAMGQQDKDLRCAAGAAASNVLLTLLLIPLYGLVGAAVATVLSDVLWFLLILYFAKTYIGGISIFKSFFQPLLGVGVMVGSFLVTSTFPFTIQLFIGGGLYIVVLLLLGEPECRNFVKSRGTSVFSWKQIPKLN